MTAHGPAEPRSGAAVPRRSVVEQLARGTRDNVGGTVVERLLGLALFASLPFLLPATDLGVYYEVTALVTLLAVVATLGLDTALVRFAAVRSATSCPRFGRHCGSPWSWGRCCPR